MAVGEVQKWIWGGWGVGEDGIGVGGGEGVGGWEFRGEGAGGREGGGSGGVGKGVGRSEGAGGWDTRGMLVIHCTPTGKGNCKLKTTSCVSIDCSCSRLAYAKLILGLLTHSAFKACLRKVRTFKDCSWTDERSNACIRPGQTGP